MVSYYVCYSKTFHSYNSVICGKFECLHYLTVTLLVHNLLPYLCTSCVLLFMVSWVYQTTEVNLILCSQRNNFLYFCAFVRVWPHPYLHPLQYRRAVSSPSLTHIPQSPLTPSNKKVFDKEQSFADYGQRLKVEKIIRGHHPTSQRTTVASKKDVSGRENPLVPWGKVSFKKYFAVFSVWITAWPFIFSCSFII